MDGFIGATTKTPNEIKRYRINYYDWLDTGETAISAVFVVNGDAGNPVTIPSYSITADGLSVTFFIAGGDDGETYSVVVRVTTSGGQVVEDSVSVTVAAAP